MNLKLHLLSRIVAVALICLGVMVAYVLHFSRQQSVTQVQSAAESLAKHLEFQLLIISAGDRPASPFPDFDLWKQNSILPGICIVYQSADNAVSRSLCKGVDLSLQRWPSAFENLYQRFFNPNLEWQRPIYLNNLLYGTLRVSSGREMVLAQAWENVRHLFGLSAITVIAVCLLVYLSVSRALRPAQTIVAGLDHLSSGDLGYRLPDFELIEWRQTATAINQLAVNQQQLLNERQKLALKLMNLQEEDRRYLSRELHDELGQCLTGIQAVSAGMAQIAEQQCPALVQDAEQISRFVQLSQLSLRDLLTRLRPAELDELGLDASLRSLITRWNKLDQGKTHYHFSLSGDCKLLPEAINIGVFRIVQEAISNITKHAAATLADISLVIDNKQILLCIKDDGKADSLPFPTDAGIGLLGMRERVMGLNGQFALSIAAPHGLLIRVQLPLDPVHAR